MTIHIGYIEKKLRQKAILKNYYQLLSELTIGSVEFHRITHVHLSFPLKSP